MDRGKWERILTQFQARGRGYLVRKEVGRAREDFEDIVREIDGDLTHVQWRETVVPTPHFTDPGALFLRHAGACAHTGLDVSISRRSPADPLPQRTEAERDDSGTKGQTELSSDRFACSLAGQDVEELQRDHEGDDDAGVRESTGHSTSLWSSSELDVNSHPRQAPRQYCLAQEVPHTPEALRLHRNTLTMELVWLQQAIDSRKKYLSLKDRLTIS